MSDTTEKLLRDAEQLVALLKDPHPGLSTWHTFVYEKIKAIAAILSERDVSATVDLMAIEYEVEKRIKRMSGRED